MATVRLAETASLLHNNLTSSPSGAIAGLHNSASLNGSKVFLHVGGVNKTGPEVVQGTSIRYLHTTSGPVLCICSSLGTRIYSEDGTTLLFHAPVQGPDQVDVPKHHRGSCLVPGLAHVVVGTYAGGLLAINVAALNAIMAFREVVPEGATDVADVCFCPAANAVITAHDDGHLRAWTPAADGNYVNVLVAPPAGEAPVACASLQSRLMVAYAAGHVRIFDAASLDLQVEITAHARCLNAVDARTLVEGEQGQSQIATVGEDTFLHVWLLDEATGQVTLQHTSHVTPKLLTGVVITQTGAAISAYDSDELFLVNFE